MTLQKPGLLVLKIGGNILDDPAQLTACLKQFAAADMAKVLVHGGGKIATAIGNKLGLKPNYIHGRRITDAATLEVVTMVYGGLINKQLVAALQALHTNAIGLTGADGNLIIATKRPVAEIDYGYVGDVAPTGVNAATLSILLQNNLVPVVAPLTHDGNGNFLNTNADTIATEIACALTEFFCVQLVYGFEKNGVLLNVDDDQSIVPYIDSPGYAELKSSGKIFAGMLPKIDNAMAASKRGVQKVVIGHALSLCNILQNTAGTSVTYG